MRLIARIQARDTGAMDEVYEEYARTVRVTLRAILRDDGIVDDLSQETFWRVWRHARSYDRFRGSVPSWIRAIARHVAIDHIRSSRYSNSPLASAERTARADHSLTRLDGELMVRTVLAHLGPDRRALMEFVFFDGFTHTQIAKRIGCPLGTIKTRIRGTLREMRVFLHGGRPCL